VLQAVYPVNLEYLEALSDVCRVHRQPTSSRHEPHEQNLLIVAQRLENLPEPLDEMMSFINLTVPTVNTCVCLSVCLSVCMDISRATQSISTSFFVHVAFGRGSVLLWRGH